MDGSLQRARPVFFPPPPPGTALENPNLITSNDDSI